MIYLLYGEDIDERRRVKDEILAAALKKEPNLTVFYFAPDEYSRAQLEETLIAQTLLGGLVAVIHNLCSAEGELLRPNLPILAASSNLYIFLETKMPPAAVKEFAAVGAEVKSFRLKSDVRQAEVNIFPLVDALGARDRKRAWVLLQEAFWRGATSEEIFWRLVWKVKTMILVKLTADPTTLDLKPFVLRQAGLHSRNFSIEELKTLFGRLVALWHDSRQGLVDFDHSLERLVLEV